MILTREGKLYWGPLWNFDLSLGNSISSTSGFNHSMMPWLDHLRENDPEFRQLLSERWAVLDAIIIATARARSFRTLSTAYSRRSPSELPP